MNCLSRTLRAKRWWCLSGMLLMTAVTVGRAAEPLAVVSLKATNDLVSDIEYLLKATGTSGFGSMILPQVKGYLQGIDGQKPIGLAVTVDGNDIRPMGFLPVSNLKAVLTQLPMLGEANDLGDGVLELQGPQPIFVKEKGGWAYIGQSAESLQQVPADPVKALDGLDEKYDLAIRAYIQNLPEQYKQLALSQIKAGLEQGLQNDQDPNARVMAEAQVAQLTQVIEEANQLTLGWRIDPQERQTYLDVSMTARPGTKLATQMAASREAKTDFAGFLAKDAAITLNMAGVIPSEDIPQTLATLDNVEKSALREIDQDEDLPDQAARDAAKRLVTTFFGIAKSTIQTGKMDSCTSVVLKDKAMTVLSAAHVASGSEVETAVKQLVEIAKGQPDMTFSNVKFNADKHAGVSFHTLSLPIPEEEYAPRTGHRAEHCRRHRRDDGLPGFGHRRDQSSEADDRCLGPVTRPGRRTVPGDGCPGHDHEICRVRRTGQSGHQRAGGNSGRGQWQGSHPDPDHADPRRHHLSVPAGRRCAQDDRPGGDGVQ